MPQGPIDTLCRYFIKPGQEQEFAKILAGHWQILHTAGLTTDEPATLTRAQDKAGNVAFFERFSWKAEDCIQAAHESPAVMKLWEPMGALCQDMEFWHVQAFEE